MISGRRGRHGGVLGVGVIETLWEGPDVTYALAFLGIAQAAENLLVLAMLSVLLAMSLWAVSMGVYFACSVVSKISQRIRLRYWQSQK